MNFYKMFAAYYNHIFPFAGSKEQFFRWLLANYSIGSALDLGAATGELVCFLARYGCHAKGIDLSPDLVALARQACACPFELADMAEFLEQTPDNCYDLITCIGNTLPHLEPKKIARAMERMEFWLAPDGLLAIQTVNYHRIMNLRPSGLPTIRRPNQQISFTRLYDYTEKNTVNFTAILETPRGISRETVSLHPVTAKEVIDMLPDSISPIHQFGGFDRSRFTANTSPAWVLVAQKGAHGT